MVRRIVLFAAIVAITCAKSHHKVESMYMSRTVRSDLAPSATGYIYRSDSNGPASYVQLGAKAIDQHLNGYPGPLPLQEHAAPQTFSAYNLQPVVKPVLPVYNTYIPQAHLASNVGVLGGQASYPNVDTAQNEEADDEDESEEEENDSGDDEEESSDENDGDAFVSNYESNFDDDTGYEATHDGGIYHGHPHGHGHSFASGGGKSYGSAGHSSHGNKGDKGYKSQHHFDKGEQGKFAKEGHQGHYNQGGGHKSGQYDKANEYSNHHSAFKGYKGGNFGEKKGHSKGSKTTGFHNVYHKDEFKKEHDFYDDAHNSGHFNKHGSAGSDHHSAKGGYVKGGHHDSAYSQGDQAKKGFSEKGSSQANDQGHAAKAGHEGYYNHHSDYAKKGGHSGGQEHGYTQKH